jgi:large subunit ribosomal protein L29
MKNRENLTELTEVELQDKFRHFKEELFNLRFQVVTGQLTNVSRIGQVKKNIARVQTQLSRMLKDDLSKALKSEYESVIKEKGIDPKRTPLKERLTLLKTKLSGKALQVRREIQTQVDSKVSELIKSIRSKISEKLKGFKGKKGGKEEDELRASSRRLADSKYVVRKKFLDKLVSMGLNEASEIKALRETKQVKLQELERIRSLQLELTSGRLPF